MNFREFAEKLGSMIREERRMTNEILMMINTAVTERIYLELGYGSMFDWLTKGFGYSHSAAFRRIEAARLLDAVPDITDKLESGKVSLTSLSKAQSIMRAQEKATGKKISAQIKKEVVDKLSGKSTVEAERTLLAEFPAAASTVHEERRIAVNETTTRHLMNLPNEVTADLDRAKEVLSHQLPNATDADIVAFAIKALLTHLDPLLKVTVFADVSQAPASLRSPTVPTVSEETKKARESVATTSAAATQNVSRAAQNVENSSDEPQVKTKRELSKAALKRALIQKANASCSFCDPQTGQICGSRFQLQIDHILPRALGGTDEPSNWRVLCRQHNLLVAEHVFGRKVMNRYRRTSA